MPSDELADTLITVVDERRHVHGQQFEIMHRMANEGEPHAARQRDYHKAMEDELKRLVVQMRDVVEGWAE